MCIWPGNELCEKGNHLLRLIESGYCRLDRYGGKLIAHYQAIAGWRCGARHLTKSPFTRRPSKSQRYDKVVSSWACEPCRAIAIFKGESTDFRLKVSSGFDAETIHETVISISYASHLSLNQLFMAAQVLIVEDDPGIQELIAVNLLRAGHVVQCASDVEAANAWVKTNLPDLLLIDWMLPGISGIEYARQLRSETRTRDVSIIMLTARDEERDKIAGLESGADDYITKPFSPRELLARITAVLRRRVPQATEEIIEVNGLRLNPASQRLSIAGIDVSLGPTEFRLLHFLMTHPGRVYTRPQLLDNVWGDNYFGEERTVDVHIRRLRAAMEATGHDSLIQTVRGSGYSFSNEVRRADVASGLQALGK